MPTSTVLNKINESRRNALVNYYLAKNVSGDEKIKTAEQLYQYLLLDTKIGHEVKTSPIAEAISSLQIYINRCVDGEEDDLHEKTSVHISVAIIFCMAGTVIINAMHAGRVKKS